MKSVEAYITSAAPAQGAELTRIRTIVGQVVPSVEEGMSYAMPAYLYKGKALLSVMVTKKHLSLYPFSGKVLESMRPKLTEYEISAGSGSLHFTLEKPLTEGLIKEIITCRMREIDAKN